MREYPQQLTAEQTKKVMHFLNRVWLGGNIELSQDKVRGEYQYFVTRAGDILNEIYYE